MSSWGNNDNSANAPLWAAATVKLEPTRTNVESLFDNTTADAFIANTTIGLFGVDADEAEVVGNVHTGWVLKTTGSGGRAGRVQQEVLVALNTMKVDGDAQVYANVKITLSGPTGASVLSNTSYANSAVFTVTPTLKGNTAAALTYQWYVNTADGSLGWTTVANGTPANTNYAGGTTASLSVKPADTTADTYVYRAIVTAADQGVSATSANATVTVSA